MNDSRKEFHRGPLQGKKKEGILKGSFLGFFFFAFFLFNLKGFIYIARFGCICQTLKAQYMSPFFPLFLSVFSLGVQINRGKIEKVSSKKVFFFSSFLNCKEAHLS